MMNFRVATPDDKDQLISLWKNNRRTLSPFFKLGIDGIINSGKLFVLADNNIVGMIGYVLKDSVIKIKYLCVDSKYRHKGYAMKLIANMLQTVGCKGCIVVAECSDGADNNTFYDKISISYTIEPKKTMNCRRYIINMDKFVKNPKPPINKGTYKNSIDLTQQFRFCGNPFRVDLYKGCTYGCKYCFANSNQTLYHNDGFDTCNIDDFKKYFSKAFDTDKETNHRIVECLRHRVPLHCGGMSDPFQPIEFDLHLTYQLIELSNKYDYPIVFSTKTSRLPDEYYEILNPKLHAFQSSIIGWSEEYIRKYETNTPTAHERADFVRGLKDQGFWCGVRIQPCINLNEVLELVDQLKDAPSYYTVEHLKIPVDNENVKALFRDEYQSIGFYRSQNNLRNIEIKPDVKKSNIRAIQELANSYGVLVGVGDNDLHYLSQSRCCCGIDTIGENFDNWLKYNLTYFITGEVEDDIWMPKCNLASCFYSGTRMNSKVDAKEATNKYIRDNKDLVPEKDKEKVTKITGVNFNKALF